MGLGFLISFVPTAGTLVDPSTPSASASLMRGGLFGEREPFKLQEHVERLFHSAELLGLTVPATQEEVRGWSTLTQPP